ncbi:MAG: hypothetical protein U9R44_02980, partial [Candidatus Omnitrophota bacterium]|nr:hypothetical protein [Candidatus Omnitrophota bacterium]
LTAINKEKKRTKKREITTTATVTSLMSQRIPPWVTFINESTGGDAPFGATLHIEKFNKLPPI